MSWLDAFFFGYSIEVLGVPFPHENVLNFTGSVTGSDDVANGRTNVNVSGGGGGGGITALTVDVTASGSGSVAATVAGIQGNPVSSTPPIAAQLLVENSGATGSAWTTVSGDSTLSATGAMVVVSLAGSSGTTVANSSVTPGTDNTYTAGTAAKRWASISAITYNVFAASGDSIAASVLTAGALTLGVGGSTAVDTRLHRTAAHVLTLDNNSTGGASLLVGGTAAYVTISQAALTPSADNAYTIGSSTDRLTSISSIEYDVYHASADANPSCRQGDGFVSFGVGGSTALDTRITRTAAKTLTLDDGAGGTSGVTLYVGGTTSTQLGITGSGLTFAAGVTAPLYTQAALTSDTLANSTTIQAQQALIVPLAGTFNVSNGSPNVTSSVSSVVSNGQVIVFAEQSAAAYTVSTVTGTSIVLTGNYTGTSLSNTTATRISATTANQINGNIVFDLNVPPIAATGPSNVNAVALKYNGLNIGFWGVDSSASALWMSSSSTSIVPSGTNPALYANGASINLNAATSTVFLSVAGTNYLSLTSSTLSIVPGNFTFSAANAVPTFAQTALASTSLASGTAGKTWTITGQSGQAATGASNNGGAGATLALLAGVGGTSGSATAGIGGLITKFCGQAWQQVTKTGSYTCDTGTTTSDLMVFFGTLSAGATCTLPTPSAGRMVFVKDKAGGAATHNITISQHSSETIDGASTLTMSKNYDAVLLMSDGTNWSIIGEYAGSII